METVRRRKDRVFQWGGPYNGLAGCCRDSVRVTVVEVVTELRIHFATANRKSQWIQCKRSGKARTKGNC